jgi:glycosyltransferase involved in cell wall biosynthesis
MGLFAMIGGMKEIHSLIISPEPPLPAYSGARSRLGFTLRALCQLGPVALAAPFRKHEEREGMNTLARELDLTVITMLAPNLRSVAHRFSYKVGQIARSLGGVSAEEHYTYFPELHHKIKAWADANRPDFVLVHYWYAAQYAADIPGKPALDAIDVAYSLLQQRGLSPQAAFAKSREADALKQFPLIFSINPNESEELAKLSDGARVELVPLAFDADPELRPSTEIDRGSIRFLGALDYSSNADGVLWFVREVFPRVLMEYPGVRFLIGGKGASRQLRTACRRPGVELAGTVDDVRKFWHQAHVAVSPLRFGTGMKLKAIEAMGCGAALAATPHGVDGVEGGDGLHYLLGEDAAGLASAVVRVLRHDELRESLSRAGWELVRDKYGEAMLRQRFQDVVQDYVSAE